MITIPTKDEAFEEFMATEIRDHGSSSGRLKSRFRRVFLAGYVAAVKAHDASGCPNIFTKEAE